MIAKQVLFSDEEGVVNDGILLDSGEVICLCCGSVFEPGDYEIIDEYEEWENLSR